MNLFVNRAGHFVVPVTSRMRFLARRVDATEEALVTLRVPDAAAVAWARVFSADGPPCRAAVTPQGDGVGIAIPRHGTASVVVAGKGPPPPAEDQDAARLTAVRDRLFPLPTPPANHLPIQPASRAAVRSAKLRVAGTQLGEPGVVQVLFDGRTVGRLSDGPHLFPVEVSPASPLAVDLQTGDEGTWFAPQRIQLLVPLLDEDMSQAAEWTPRDPVEVLPGFGGVRYPLRWEAPRRLPTMASRFERRDGQTGGKWPGRCGSQAVWIPQLSPAAPQNKFQLRSGGQAFAWKDASDDSRVLFRPGGAGRCACDVLVRQRRVPLGGHAAP